MDQCVAMGRDSIGLMEFNESHCSLHKLSSPVPIHFVVADMKAGKDTVVILRSLNECFPEPSSPQQVIFIFIFLKLSLTLLSFIMIYIYNLVYYAFIFS